MNLTDRSSGALQTLGCSEAVGAGQAEREESEQWRGFSLEPPGPSQACLQRRPAP